VLKNSGFLAAFKAVENFNNKKSIKKTKFEEYE
jgi:hypothetical protein